MMLRQHAKTSCFHAISEADKILIQFLDRPNCSTKFPCNADCES